MGNYLGLVVGGLIFHLSYILDCADGYIARKKGLASPIGHWLDHTFDEIKKPALLISLLLGQGAFKPGFAWAWIGAILYMFSRVLVKTDSTVKQNESSHESLIAAGGSQMWLTPRQKWLFEHFGIVIVFTSIEAQAICFVIGPLVGLPLYGILAAAALSILWFVYVDGFRYWMRKAKVTVPNPSNGFTTNS